jgi:hypothetical protein
MNSQHPIIDGRSGDGDVPPELGSLEARLATLRPRHGRFHGEQLIYELGRQAGLAERSRGVSFATALVTTTASSVIGAAAAVLVMLSLSAQRPTAESLPVAGPSPALQKTDGQLVEFVKEPDRDDVFSLAVHPVTRSGWGDWKMLSGAATQTRSDRIENLERLLRQGANPWVTPSSKADLPPTSSTMTPYIEQRKNLLDPA